MSEETKNEELQEEVEATDVVTEEKVEEQPQEDAQNEELQKALERAEDFENKYLRAHAECKTFNVALMKNVSNCKNIVHKI